MHFRKKEEKKKKKHVINGSLKSLVQSRGNQKWWFIQSVIIKIEYGISSDASNPGNVGGSFSGLYRAYIYLS